MNNSVRCRMKSATIIFIVGSSRSGTTMLGRALSRHSSVHTFRELHFFEYLWSGDFSETIEFGQCVTLMTELLSIEHDGYLSSRNPSLYRDEAKSILDPDTDTPGAVFFQFLASNSERQGKSIPCDQTPRNIFYLGEILRLYPNARVINMVRDPRDVLLSQKNKWRRRSLGAKNIPLAEAMRSRVNYHPITVSKLWSSAQKAASFFSESPQVRSIRFDALLNEPDSVLRDICGFIGIGFEPAMLEIPRVGSSLKDDKNAGVGFDRTRIGNWSAGGLTPTEIYLCEKMTHEYMADLGYDTSNAKPQLHRLVLSLCWFPLHVVAIILVNFMRAKSLFAAIRRRLQ